MSRVPIHSDLLLAPQSVSLQPHADFTWVAGVAACHLTLTDVASAFWMLCSQDLKMDAKAYHQQMNTIAHAQTMAAAARDYQKVRGCMGHTAVCMGFALAVSSDRCARG